MNREEIIRMAREAGFSIDNDGRLKLVDGNPLTLSPECCGTLADGLKELARIAYEAGAAAEREQDGNCKRCDGEGCVACDARKFDTALLRQCLRVLKDIDSDDPELNQEWEGRILITALRARLEGET